MTGQLRLIDEPRVDQARREARQALAAAAIRWSHVDMKTHTTKEMEDG